MNTSSFTAAICGMACMAGISRAATFEVDKDRSRIQVDAKATGHSFSGDLKKYTLTAEGNPGANTPTALNLSWEFNDLKTADDKRDKAMIEWLGGGKPKGSFVFEKSWEEKPEGGKAQGKLTINGVTKQVAFPYTIKKEGEWLTLDGSVTMDYQNFKLPIIRAMLLMTVDPKLVVRFHVVGKAN